MNNSIIRWLQRNLFMNWTQSILTILALLLLYKTIPPILNWTVFKANFNGTGPESCTSGGACWVFVKMRLNQFLYGYYPRDLQWRINLAYLIGTILLLIFLFSSKQYKTWAAGALFIIYPISAYILFEGGIFGLEEVDTYSWGGLHLTLVLGMTSIILSIPIGIILALCRRSHLPAIKYSSAIFIDLWRGVPLVSVLFMASFLIPLLFSSALHFDKVLRALIGITLVFSAYMADIIYTGLHELPKGQFEASQALGFGYFGEMYLIILPQALRNVIPSIVNIIISLFKETTLVLIIGLFDFLGMIQAANQDPKWLAYGLEGYVFGALVFWVFCFLMSRYSKYLEQQHKARLRQ
jgi:general L-amino acid transport system permease protein